MNVKISLPLSEYSFAQKLDLMEELWNDLTKEEAAYPSPEWHETVLKEREEAMKAGKLAFSDWDEAKIRIRERIYARKNS